MEEIGSHRLTNKNIMDGLDDLMDGFQADIALIDPPWGEGNEKYWHTILAKVDPSTAIIRPEHNDFLNQFFKLLKKHTKPDSWVFVEYGVRWVDEIIQIGESQGLRSLAVVELTYKAGGKVLPKHMHIFAHTNRPLPAGLVDSMTGLVEFEAMKMVIPKISEPGQIMLDTCSGLGGFAKIAQKSGMRYFGNEMNPQRWGRTKGLLESYANLQ